MPERRPAAKPDGERHPHSLYRLTDGETPGVLIDLDYRLLLVKPDHFARQHGLPHIDPFIELQTFQVYAHGRARYPQNSAGHSRILTW